LIWCESNPRHLPHLQHLLPNPSHHMSSKPTDTHPGRKIPGSLHIHFCYMKYLPDRMYTVHVRCIFENMKQTNIQIWNMQIWNIEISQ
jgi:hypothetical protein